jgi:phospho-N-acetylmuramoyl-pentapeptide-transferase
MENVSVVLQVGWFKYTAKNDRRRTSYFLNVTTTPSLSKKKRFHEDRSNGSWIVGILLCDCPIVTLKVMLMLKHHIHFFKC